MFARLIEGTVGVIDAGTAKVFLGSEARDGSFSVSCEAILAAHGCQAGVAVCLLRGAGVRQLGCLALDLGLQRTEEIARDYFKDAPERWTLGARYLQDNIKYSLGVQERAGLDLFYRYAVEAGVVEDAEPLRFY